MNTQELVKKSVDYAKYFRYRAKRHTDPAEINRLLEHAKHCMKLARAMKSSPIKTRSY